MYPPTLLSCGPRVCLFICNSFFGGGGLECYFPWMTSCYFNIASKVVSWQKSCILLATEEIHMLCAVYVPHDLIWFIIFWKTVCLHSRGLSRKELVNGQSVPYILLQSILFSLIPAAYSSTCWSPDINKLFCFHAPLRSGFLLISALYKLSLLYFTDQFQQETNKA